MVVRQVVGYEIEDELDPAPCKLIPGDGEPIVTAKLRAMASPSSPPS
jgi:hypothetical protein